MDPKLKDSIELDLQIEELESRIAPDGGETVLPMSSVPGHGGPSHRPPRPR